MGVAVRPPVRERIDDKTSFVSLHSRTFITAVRSEAIDGKNERTLALPVGSFTRVAPKDCYFEWGGEEREPSCCGVALLLSADDRFLLDSRNSSRRVFLPSSPPGRLIEHFSSFKG